MNSNFSLSKYARYMTGVRIVKLTKSGLKLNAINFKFFFIIGCFCDLYISIITNAEYTVLLFKCCTMSITSLVLFSTFDKIILSSSKSKWQQRGFYVVLEIRFLLSSNLDFINTTGMKITRSKK